MAPNEKFKIAKVRAGLTEKALSKVTGISASMISDIETGYRLPYKWQAVLLAQTLNVKPEDIFPQLRPERVLIKMSWEHSGNK